MEQAIERGDRIYKLFNMKIEEASQQYSKVTMPIQEHALNGMGFVHGGVVFCLADIAFGAAANYGQKTGTVTLSANIQFLQPGKHGPLVGEAKLIRGGKHIVVYNIDIYDALGILVAHGTYEGFRTDFAFSNFRKNGE